MICHRRLNALYCAVVFLMLGCAGMAAAQEKPVRGFAPPEDLTKNDAQFTCMNFVSGALGDDASSAKFDFFKYYASKVLTDGAYNVLVTYDLSGKHTVSCTVTKTTTGDWKLVETKELK